MLLVSSLEVMALELKWNVKIYINIWIILFNKIFSPLFKITFSYNLQLILSLVSDCMSVPLIISNLPNNRANIKQIFLSYRFFFKCFSVILYSDLGNHFHAFENKEALCYSCKCEAWETKHKINKNRHGSSHVIAWAALPYLLI